MPQRRAQHQLAELNLPRGVQPALTVTAADHAYGGQLVGTSSSSVDFSLTDSGSADLHLSA